MWFMISTVDAPMSETKIKKKKVLTLLSLILKAWDLLGLLGGLILRSLLP